LNADSFGPIVQVTTIQRPSLGRRNQGQPAPVALDRLHLLPDAALKNGVHIVGGPGSGKSRLMGRILAWQAFLRGKPVVVLDPTGGIVANVVDKIARLPRPVREKLWPRIVYVDAGATDYVVPTPVYYRNRDTDTLFEIANRLPGVLKRQDPQLQSAPILGWNSLLECAIHSGQIAAALGEQLDFVADLISQPRQYKETLRRALADCPELEPAVSYFRELMDPNNSGLRERRTGSFANKLLPFLADPTMLATFAAPRRGVDWDAVARQGQLVIIDFQHERDPERRQFKLLWWYRDFSGYIKTRGMAGRGHEILFLIDEVTQLVGQRTGEGNSILAEDLEETVAVDGRNYGVNVVIAHQNLSQVDERIRNILMQCGTQIIGRIANPDDALFLARQFLRYDPYAVKKQEPVWMSVTPLGEGGMPMGFAQPHIVDHRDVEFSPEEQVLLTTEQFRLPRFQFLVRPATAEGTVSDQLYRISIEKLDAGQYPDAQQVKQVLAYLRRKSGVAVAALLAEIRQRRAAQEGSRQIRMKQNTETATLVAESSPPYDTASTSPPATAAADNLQVAAQAATGDEGAGNDSFWR
jgi:hypothetical protein